MLDHRSRELSRFESLLALIVVALVVYLLLARLDGLFARVEKARLTTSLAHMNTALTMVAAAGLIRGDQSMIADLQDANPMALDDRSPTVTTNQTGANLDSSDDGRYLGAFASPDPATMPPGKWYFDTVQGYLIYRVEAEEYFHTTLSGAKRARFRVNLEFTDINGNGRFDANVDRFSAVSLDAVENYRWIPRDIL